jgi:hypothetical protein
MIYTEFGLFGVAVAVVSVSASSVATDVWLASGLDVCVGSLRPADFHLREQQQNDCQREEKALDAISVPEVSLTGDHYARHCTISILSSPHVKILSNEEG